jgi:Uma2 family endonuclease
MAMSVQTLIPVEEYLSTSYSPDREYRDGALMERNVGDRVHARLQLLLGSFIHRRAKQWGVIAFTELRIRIAEGCYRIPDLCVYPLPAPEDRFPSTLPLLWIEIISQDDKMVDVWAKAKELIAHGVPYVWIVEPNTLASELWTAAGVVSVPDGILRIPNTPIEIPLAAVMEE